MSWSVSIIGEPEKLVQELEHVSTTLTGESKQEFDSVLPHITGLVKANFNKNQSFILKLDASGHGYFINGEQQEGVCRIAMDLMYTKIVV